MSKVQQANEYLEIKQPTDRDVRQLGVLTSARYEADSITSQTVINLTFSVTQTVEQKRGFQLFIDGQLLREGASNDFQFTGIVGGMSSQVTLNAPIAAGLNIIALKVGGYQDLLPNASTLQAQANSTSLQLDNKGNINRFINGSFEFWQRGTSFPAITDGSFFADRWKYSKNATTAVHTIARDTDVPSTAFGVYSAATTITTADAAVGATDLVVLRQFIEGNFFRPLKGKNIVLQFWVKSPKVGIHSVSVLNSAQNRSLIKEYTVNVANTWEQKQIRFSHDTTGTWLYDTGVGLGVNFVLMAGSNFFGTVNTWGTSTVYASSSQVNVCDTIGNSFKVTDVMMVEDNTATNSLPNFIMAGNNLAEELRLCQRYYEIGGGFARGDASNGNVGAVTIYFKSDKRVAPLTVSNASWSHVNGGAAFTPNSTTLTNIQTWGGASGIGQNGSGGTANYNYTLSFTADAEL